MRTTHGLLPAYNVQAAVDAEHALIVVQQVTDHAADNRSNGDNGRPQRPRAGRRSRDGCRCSGCPTPAPPGPRQ